MANELKKTDNNGIPILSDEDFANLFESSLAVNDLKEGDLVKGRIIQVLKDMVMVDIGYKSEGLIDIDEFRTENGDIEVKIGDEIEVVLEEIEGDEGLIVLSKEKADRMKVWEDIATRCEADELIEGIITARVKGGLSVDVGVKAFLPGSQVDLRPVRNLDKMIGQKYQFKIIKFNKKRGNIVLSRRALLEKEREELKTKTLEHLSEGMEVTGIVKNITNYGAFVDLGGIDGLLHITDMSWGRINHPSELFSVGDEIKVKVLKFDEDKERVSLGLKQLTPDPWVNISERYPINNKVSGKVVSLTDYGAFVELEAGVEGLIHISEMSWAKRVKHPSKLLSIGDEVEVVILDINAENRRISLGMKQVEPNPWTLLEEKYSPGTVIRGRIRNITDFGIFIGVEEGIDGLVHISDISWIQKFKHPNEVYQKGQEVEAVVLSIDPEKERFSLGIKQLTPDPWKKLAQRCFPGMVVEGRISKVTDFGAFMELDDGIEGLVHISELSSERVENPADVIKEGEVVKAEVKHIDPVERKLSLSIRSLRENKEKMEMAEHLNLGDDTTTTLGAALRQKLSGFDMGGSKPAEEPKKSEE